MSVLMGAFNVLFLFLGGRGGAEARAKVLKKELEALGSKFAALDKQVALEQELRMLERELLHKQSRLARKKEIYRHRAARSIDIPPPTRCFCSPHIKSDYPTKSEYQMLQQQFLPSLLPHRPGSSALSSASSLSDVSSISSGGSYETQYCRGRYKPCGELGCGVCPRARRF